MWTEFYSTDHCKTFPSSYALDINLPCFLHEVMPCCAPLTHYLPLLLSEWPHNVLTTSHCCVHLKSKTEVSAVRGGMWCSSCLELYLIERSTGAEGRPENTADITGQRWRSMCAKDKVTVERERELANPDPVGNYESEFSWWHSRYATWMSHRFVSQGLLLII